MKIKLDNMEYITLDIGYDVVVQRYRDGLLITELNSDKESNPIEFNCEVK